MRVLNVGLVPPNSILLRADSSISAKSLSCSCVRALSFLKIEILFPNALIRILSESSKIWAYER